MAFFQNNPRTRTTVQSRIQNSVVTFSTTVRQPAAPTVATTQKKSLCGEPTEKPHAKIRLAYFLSPLPFITHYLEGMRFKGMAN